jgi:glucose-6-phosphate isomerase
LANVDPNDFYRATQGLDPETTLVVVNSKTFTTAETMLNAKTVRNWILEHYKKNGAEINNLEDEKKIIGRHMCAASTNLKETSTFGIDDSSVFGFWDWVGGRYSVTSAVGILPLSLHFGFKVMRDFLDGAGSIDTQFVETEDIQQNVPLMLGLLGFYRITIQGHSSKAILPYSQALCKFAPHIQQVDMESNGKRVSLEGEALNYETGVVNFGEPGTNGQHSFYQLIHQGTINCFVNH